MTLEISGLCPHCSKTFSVSDLFAQCPTCSTALFGNRTDQMPHHLDQCPACGCTHLYQQKDFNKKIGLFFLVIGIVLAYWTYGLSLVAITAIDWLIARRVGTVGLCYLCEMQFRGDVARALPAFNLALLDHYRAVRKNRAASLQPGTQ